MMPLVFDAFICFIGLALHLAMKWGEARQITKLSLTEYVKDVPAQTAVAVLASIGTFSVAFAMDWINAGMAFTCGYMGHSLAENYANKYLK